MAITTTLAACSTTPSANGPDGSVDAPSTLDDAIRNSLSFIATLRDTKAPLASPAFTGTPTAPTVATADNSTTLATTAFVKAAVVAGQSGVGSFNGRSGAVTLSGSDVTSAIGYMPYNATNPSGYISSISSGNVTSALGYTPVQQGTGVGQIASNVMKLGWDGSTRVKVTVDNVDQGNVAMETSANTFSQNQTMPSINGGQLAGLRNRIINGNFAVNQRAVSGTVTLAAGVYGHDRWKAGAGGCTYTFAASGADTIITISAGSLLQVIEGNNIEGGTYRLSQQGTAQARIAVNGAATSGSYAANPQTSASATGGQNVSVEFTTGTIDRAQIELGTVATTFERRMYGLELAMCQRYYEIGSLNTAWYYTGTLAPSFTQPFKVSKRATPSMAYTSGPTYTNSSNANLNAPTANEFNYGPVTTATGVSSVVFSWSASVEL